MITFEDKLYTFIQGIKSFFSDKFISFHIFNFDGLLVESSRNHPFKEEVLGPLAISLLFAIHRFCNEISKEDFQTTVLTSSNNIFVFSEIKGFCLVLIVLQNEGNDNLIEYGKHVSINIEKIMKNLTLEESEPLEVNSFPFNFYSKKPQVYSDKSETLQIQYAINLMNNIMARGAYKTNLADKILIKTGTLEKNTLSNNLDLLIISLKRLYNNFDMTLKGKF